MTATGRPLRLSRVHYPVVALGPGTRLGIWFQGCALQCRGCVSTDTWPAEAGTATTVDEVVASLDDLTDQALTGVTISGGEPFEQPEALAELVAALRTWGETRASRPPLDIACYSGFDLARLESEHSAILAQLDVVISGPYQAGRPTIEAWMGSANQVITLVTDLARQRWQAPPTGAPSIQVEVDDDGAVWMIGIPRRGDLARLERGLAGAGVHLEGASWRP